jgi:uncharacterized membrane protein (UPF0127 family)
MKTINRKVIFKWFLVTVFLIVLVFIFLHNQSITKENSQVQNLPASSISYIKIGGVKLKVDLALTPETQAQGLSGRSGLQDDEGMLFVFNNPGKYFFWMKDMNFPIDMIWISQDLHVVYIKQDAEPDSYPQTFVSNQDAEYVLEVSSFFAEKNNLKEGDQVQFLSS